MSEQDDLSKKDAERKEEELSSSAAVTDNESVDGHLPEEVGTQPVPDSEPAINAGDLAGLGGAAGEVRVVEPPPKQGSSAYLLLALVLLVALLAGGYFLVNGGLSEKNPLAETAQRPAPKRYPIDMQVKEEVVDQKQIAAVETGPESAREKPVATVKKAAAVPVKKAVPVAKIEQKQVAAYRVLVGPYLTKKGAEKAAEKLQELGYSAEETKGRGKVSLTRLLEGVYPRDEARERLTKVKETVGDAFMLPTGEKWAIYVGSFTDADRAARYMKKLAGKGISVTPVASVVEMDGRMLIAARGDRQTAQKASALISAAGFSSQVLKK